MSETNWYYISDSRNKGPISESELRTLFASQMLPLQTQVWNESMPAWVSASSVELFRSAAITDLDERKGSIEREEATAATWGIPVGSAKKDPFQYLRFRSLFGWAILGFLLVLLLVYICPFGEVIREYTLITYILLVSAEIWVLFWVLWKFRKYKLSWKRFLGGMPSRKNWKVIILLLIGMWIFSYGGFYLYWYSLSFPFPNYVEFGILNGGLFTSYEYIPSPLSQILIITILIVFVAPFVEELIFRGIILRRWAGKWGIKKSIVLSSVLFALMHHDILGTFIFAIVMSIFYLRYKTLWIPILCHAIWNSICVIVSYLLYHFTESTYCSLYEFRSYLWLGILSVCLSIPWIVIYLQRNWIQVGKRYQNIVGGSSIYKEGGYIVVPSIVKRKKETSRYYYLTLLLMIMLGLSVRFTSIWIFNHRFIHPTDMKSPERLYYMLEHRRGKIPEIREYETLFPNYLCEIKRSSYPSKEADWEFTAGIYRRYVIIMNIDIVIGKRNPETGEIEDPGSHNEPEFSLWEVTQVKLSRDTYEYWHPEVTKTKVQSINTDTWNRLVAANGDLSVLGIEFIRDEPVPNFLLAFRNSDMP